MLKLIPAGGGIFDLAFDDPAADDAAAAAATLVYAALFTDAEAPAARAPDRFDRRGWWAGAQAGSGLWHVRRQALSDSARREALAMVRQALTARAPALTDVVVSEVLDSQPAGNVSRVSLEISGFHNGRKFIVRAGL